MAKTKVDPEIVKARNRARAHFRREAQAYEDREAKEARETLYRLAYRQSREQDRIEETRDASIMRWVTGQAQAVFASLDITPRIETQIKRSVDGFVASGYTDFRSINVTVNTALYDENKPEQIARMIAMTKGLLYHEGGHILYTVPVMNLLEQSTTQGYTPPFVTSLVDNPTDDQVTFEQYKWVWNLLEDQRMECAVVRMSPVIERYLKVLVLDVVIQSSQDTPHRAWPFISGRSYLPKTVLSQFRRIAVEWAQNNDLIDTLSNIDRLVRAYKRATTEREMAEIVYETVPHVRRWLGFIGGAGNTDSHDSRRDPEGLPSPTDSSTEDSGGWPTPSPKSESDKSGKPTPSNSDKSDDGDTDSDTGVGQPGDTTDTTDTTAEGEDAEAEGENESDDNTEGMEGGTDGESESHDPSTGNGSSLGGSDTASRDDQQGLDDLLRDTQSEIIDDLISNETLSSLAGDVNDAVRRGMSYDPTIQDMPADLVAQAHEVRNGMLNTLEPLAVQADPSWRFRQESGVLDPTAFVNREDGDTDFWIGLDDNGATGHDLAVSVVLDVSYSMQRWTDALSVGALGIRMACDDLDIPCTISTFASEGYVWMEAEDETVPTLIQAHGGTYPMSCLEDLQNQSKGKSRHLVVVFTDGDWSGGVPSLDQFRTPGMYIVGTAFGWDVAESVARRRPDVTVTLNSVSQLPEEVTKALVGYLI